MQADKLKGSEESIWKCVTRLIYWTGITLKTDTKSKALALTIIHQFHALIMKAHQSSQSISQIQLTAAHTTVKWVMFSLRTLTTFQGIVSFRLSRTVLSNTTLLRSPSSVAHGRRNEDSRERRIATPASFNNGATIVDYCWLRRNNRASVEVLFEHNKQLHKRLRTLKTLI